MIRHFPRHLIHCLPSPAFSISLSLALSLTISPASSLSLSFNLSQYLVIFLSQIIYLSIYLLSLHLTLSLFICLSNSLSLSLPLFFSFFQDIDSLLEQRAHVLVTENAAQTESWLNKRKKASRAKYVLHEKHEHIYKHFFYQSSYTYIRTEQFQSILLTSFWFHMRHAAKLSHTFLSIVWNS